MPGRYQGNRQMPEGQKVPWINRAGRWLARRGYDVINAAVPGTVFDYREHGTVNPRQAFNDGTVAESVRYLRGRPEGMSDEEWAQVRQEGREGLFDTGWDLLPIPRIPVVTGAVRRGTRNLLLGGKDPSKPSDRPPTRTVVPTVSGAGVTTSETPVTVPGGTSAPDVQNPGRNSSSRSRSSQSGSKPPLFGEFTGNTSGTRGHGWEVADGSTSNIMNMLGMQTGAYSGIGYKPISNHDKPFLPSAFLEADLVNTTTGDPFYRNRNITPTTGRESQLTRSTAQRD